MKKLIFNYIPLADDYSIDNPYLMELEQIKKSAGDRLQKAAVDFYLYRDSLIAKYSFSVPTIAVLRIIAAHSPLVEIGAGSGYWAYCLEQIGADTIAYDIRPPSDTLPWPWGKMEQQNFWFEEEWSGVNEGDEISAGRHPDRSLFLCWPEFNTRMAWNSLKEYLNAGGRKLIYIGDPCSSGDAFFHEELKRHTLVNKVKLWSWGVNDETLYIYELAAAASMIRTAPVAAV